ncbi:MAG: hypothetical protein ABSF78_12265 [Candidatus Acidiferrales bacterium]|jgi:hypothetical protein
MTHLTNRLGHRGLRWACFPLLLMFVAALTGSPLRAQVDLAGEWTENLHEDMPERGDVAIGDYLSLPINDATRMRADTWDAEQWTMVEHLCHAHPLDYAPRGPSQMRIWSDVDPLTQGVSAWHTIISYMLPERTIYMDGRPHPPEWAAHTWQGFSTGEWVGDMLKVTTTHLKEGYFRRNGLARSEKATVTEYFIRYPTTLTLVTIVEDPVYLTEPFIITSDWIQDIGRQLSPNFCISSVEIDHPKGWVAYHLPGENPWLNEYSQRTGVPYEAVRGGAETMYPEYQKKLEKMPVPPPLPKESAETGR